MTQKVKVPVIKLEDLSLFLGDPEDRMREPTSTVVFCPLHMHTPVDKSLNLKCNLKSQSAR